MKKALSVLLTVTMLLGCFSVGFVSFAASYPADEAAMAEMLKDTSTYATQTTFITVNNGAWNENTYVSLPATYTYFKTVTNSEVAIDDNTFKTAAGSDEAYEANVLVPIAESGEYEEYIYRDNFGTAAVIDLAKLVADNISFKDIIAENGLLPVSVTTNNVGKTGNNVLGDDALKIVELDPSEIRNYNPVNGKFNLDDIVVVDQTDPAAVITATEDSSLAKVANVIASEVADDILETIRRNELVSDVTNYKFIIRNIEVAPQFKENTVSETTIYGDEEYLAGSKHETLYKLDVNFNIEFSGDVRFVFSDVAVPFNAKQNVKNSYYSINEILDSLKDPSTLEYIAGVIEDETAAIEATPEDAYPAGYTFSKKVSVDSALHSPGASILDAAPNAAIKNVIDDKYPEYGYLKNTNEESALYGEYYSDDLGRYTYDEMLLDSTGLAYRIGNGYYDEIVYDGTEYNVAKGVNANEVIGIDALKTMVIDTEKIASYTYDAYSRNIEITFKDQVVYPSDGEECEIACLYNNMLPDDLDVLFATNFNENTLGSTIEDIEIKYVTPILTVTYNAGEVEAIKLTYKIVYAANLYLANTVAAYPISGSYDVVIKYMDIRDFDLETDIDPYELVKAINDGTHYAIYNKAGYDYERNAYFTMDPVADVSDNAIGKVTGVIDLIAGLLGASVTDKINSLISDMVLGDMDVTDFSGNVPLAQDGVDYLGSNYALKETSILPNDLINVAYNADREVIVFGLRDQLNPEKDEANALSRLTNDFTSASDLRNKLTLQLVNDLGISFISDDEPCDVTYKNIAGYVAFNGCDEDNTLGDGTISTFGVGYDGVLSAKFSDIKIDAEEKMTSIYDDFDYFDYEMGDVDMSTRVSVVDAKLVLKDVAGTYTINGRSFELADMNYDKKISIADAKQILKKIAYK